ncbi:Hypothetical_protein [Hexamita inflata]|uniref:Hypothetical_protein n=1 Tax=Hexamita inflata TaxID=28002 RepID=A0ABP1HRY7_9EUKA
MLTKSLTFNLQLSHNQIHLFITINSTFCLYTLSYNNFTIKISDTFEPQQLNIQCGYYANVLAELIFPLFISYIDFEESKCYELVYLARKLQQLYLNDLDSLGAVQFKEVSQQQYFSKTSKVMQCRQFLNKELMSELYVRTNLILDILENQSNINSFGTTTNTVECEFGLTKNLCNGKQTPQVMKGVISRQLKQKAAFYQNNNDQE